MYSQDFSSSLLDDENGTYFDTRETRDSDELVLLVHGLGGSTKSHFSYLLPVLGARQRCLSVDWSCALQSEASDQLDRAVSYLATFLEEELGGPRVTLVGYSLGAVVSAVLASRRPDLVERLVLVAGWSRADTEVKLRADIWRALRSDSDESVLRKYALITTFGGPHLNGQDVAKLLPTMHDMVADETVDLQWGIAAQTEIQSVAEAISVPTLVIACSYDEIAPRRHQLALFGAIDDARFVEIETGHAVVHERPSELAYRIQEFIDEPHAYPAGTFVPMAQP